MAIFLKHADFALLSVRKEAYMCVNTSASAADVETDRWRTVMKKVASGGSE